MKNLQLTEVEQDTIDYLYDELDELPNECMWCGEPIAEDKMFCSKQCLTNDLNDNRDE